MSVDEPYHTLQWVREKAPVPQSPLGGPLQVPDALAEQLTLQPTYGNNCPLLRVVPSSGKARPEVRFRQRARRPPPKSPTGRYDSTQMAQQCEIEIRSLGRFDDDSLS